MFAMKHETNIGLILAKGLQHWLNINSQLDQSLVFVSHVSKHVIKLLGVYANEFLTGYINIHAIYLFHTVSPRINVHALIFEDALSFRK